MAATGSGLDNDALEYLRPHGLQRMLGRNPHDRHRVTTPLELLFDLTFVVGFSLAADQLAHSIAAGHIGTAIGGFAFVVLSVCWAWINYTWFTSAFDTDDWLQRVLTMVQMIGSIVLALGIAPVFASIDEGRPFDYRVVAAGYVIMRASLIAMYARVAAQDPDNRRVALRYVLVNALIQAAWVTVAVLQPQNVVLLVSLVTILWAAELASHPYATWDSVGAKRRWRDTPWNARHISERYGLLVIITLGEVILGTITAVAAVVGRVGWSVEAILLVVSGTGLAFGLWWTYFILPSAPVLARHRNRRWAWGYGHIVLFGALAAVGAGLHVAAYAVEGHSSIGTLGVVLSVVIPVLVVGLAYFTIWSVLFRRVDRFHVMLVTVMVAILALAVLLAVAGLSVGWCLLVATLSPFVVSVAYETAGYRHVEADLRREG